MTAGHVVVMLSGDGTNQTGQGFAAQFGLAHDVGQPIVWHARTAVGFDSSARLVHALLVSPIMAGQGRFSAGVNAYGHHARVDPAGQAFWPAILTCADCATVRIVATTKLLTGRDRDKLGRVQPRPSPTIPRWQLGKELARLREEKDLTYEQVAKAVGVSASSIRRYEAGTTGVGRPALNSLLELYEVTDPAQRERLLEWQTLGKRPGWWSRFGRLPEEATALLGFESAATTVRMFEQAVVPGLLQTEGYARAMMAALAPGLSEDELNRYVQLRLARQENVAAAKPQMWVILEETAIRRPVGGAEQMRGQLTHLLEVGRQWPVQVIPLDVGPHPGTAGGFMIWEFLERTPVVFVDSQAGNLFLEEEADIARFTLQYNHMRAVALSPEQSAKLIARTLQEIS